VFASGATLGFLNVKLEAVVLAALSILFIAGAKFLLDYMERLAIKEGRITENRR
jgi:hypothetical protein